MQSRVRNQNGVAQCNQHRTTPNQIGSGLETDMAAKHSISSFSLPPAKLLQFTPSGKAVPLPEATEDERLVRAAFPHLCDSWNAAVIAGVAMAIRARAAQ